MNISVNLIGFLIVISMAGGDLFLRYLSQIDIQDLSDRYMESASLIAEKHAEFKVYQHAVAVQHGQLMLMEYGSNNSVNNGLLSDFYQVFDEMTGVFTFRENASDSLSVDGISELMMFGDPEGDEQCVEMNNMESSYLATCIEWKECGDMTTESLSNYTDCSLYKAIEETYEVIKDNDSSGVVAWSLPFVCFGNLKICYVGLVRERVASLGDSVEGQLFVGALLSMDQVSDTVMDVFWTKSGMQEVCECCEVLENAEDVVKCLKMLKIL